MSARPWRRRALYGALAVTIVLSIASGKDWRAMDESVQTSKLSLPRVSRSSAQPAPRIELDRLPRENAAVATDAVVGNAFRAMSWYVPPPPPPPSRPLPPPPPMAPPMPFSFLGRYEEGSTRIILLVRGDRIYTVAEGEVIDNTYRVEKLAGGQLELTYLPLNITQTISAGGT